MKKPLAVILAIFAFILASKAQDPRSATFSNIASEGSLIVYFTDINPIDSSNPLDDWNWTNEQVLSHPSQSVSLGDWHPDESGPPGLFAFGILNDNGDQILAVSQVFDSADYPNPGDAPILALANIGGTLSILTEQQYAAILAAPPQTMSELSEHLAEDTHPLLVAAAISGLLLMVSISSIAAFISWYRVARR